MMLDGIEWTASAEPISDEALRDGLPYVTHSGVLDIAGVRLRCYQLSSGERVFDAGDIEDLLGFCRAEVQV